MKKIPVTLFVVSALLFILPEKTEAQSLKDILKSETAQKVIDAVKAYMLNNEITTKELMRYLKGPDFPTGGSRYSPSSFSGASGFSSLTSAIWLKGSGRFSSP